MFGKLANAAIGTTNTVIYTVPTTGCRGAEIDIDIVNTTTSAIDLELAIASSTTPSVAEYVEKAANIQGNSGHLVRSGDKLSPGEVIVAKGSAAGLNIRVSGREIVN